MLKLVCFVYLFHDVLSSNYFCKFPCGKEHTACKREPCGLSSKCNSAAALPLDKESRQWVVDIHNNYRSKLALGQDTRGGNGKAANMHVLSYDKELEYVAQCWANACGEEGAHDACRSTKQFLHVGQNMYFGGTTGKATFTDKTWIESAIRDWYEEIQHTQAAIIDSFHSSLPTIGHFTQAMWAKTTHVGCGRTQTIVQGMHGVYIYCNYGPTGNILSQPVYMRGDPCSKCGSLTCNDKYAGLCGKIKSTDDDSWNPPFRATGAITQMSLYKVVALAAIFYLL